MINQTILDITKRLIDRSQLSRKAYLEQMHLLRKNQNHELEPSNVAHILAGLDQERKVITRQNQYHSIGIISAYNEMVSAHVPFATYPDKIKRACIARGHNATMIGGVPAICDGVVQGYDGMEISLLSRDVIAMSTAIPISCSTSDRIVLLGTCDKIVPGMLIGALSRGYLPAAFIPSGTMSSQISNKEKSAARQAFHCAEISKGDLLDIECKCYHGPGTCTFYGTANTNQVMLEALGLQPINSGLAPVETNRDQLIQTMIHQLVEDNVPALSEVVDEYAIINACIVWLATGGSTNHTLHLVAIARAAGIQLQWQDLAELSEVVPLLARIYPNGDADVNDFHRQGGVGAVMKELLSGGLLHANTIDYSGTCLTNSLQSLNAVTSNNPVIASIQHPFSPQGGIKVLKGNLGQGVMKVSAVSSERRRVTAPARVFCDQQEVYKAYQNDELWQDVVIVLKNQGVQANGMPELHKLMPILGNIYDKGFNVALITDGRLSGASGKVPAVVHITPEASRGGLIGTIIDGDIIEVDGVTGKLDTQLIRGNVSSYNGDSFEGYQDIFKPLRLNANHPSNGGMACF